MKILLSFYPDFKIRQLSDHTATMWLSNEFDLFMDVNDNPGRWTAQRKRGNIRNDMTLRGGRVPKDDVEKADALIKRYQEALVSHVMEMEKNEKGMIKKDIEVLNWPKKNRGQAPASELPSPGTLVKLSENNEVIKCDGSDMPIGFIGPQPPALADPEGSQEEEGEKVAMPMVLDLIQHGLKPAPADPEESQERKEVSQEGKKLNSVSVPALEAPERNGQDKDKVLEAQRLEDNLKEYLELTKAPEKPINQALPEEPNLEEIQEAPTDPEESQPEEERKPYKHPLGPGYYALPCHPLDPYFKNLVSSEAAVDLHTWDEKDKALEEKIQEIRNKEPEEAQDLKTRLTEKIINSMEAGKLQPGENYSEKIEAKKEDILTLIKEILYTTQYVRQLLPHDLKGSLTKIEESLEVLQLLQDCQKRQNLRDLQRQEPAKEKQEQAAELNEVYINKNSKGYSWRITARAADMKEAVKYALFADEVCKGIQKKGAGDNES